MCYEARSRERKKIGHTTVLQYRGESATSISWVAEAEFSSTEKHT